MKKLLVLAAMTVAATNAFAGVKLVVRSDYVNTPKYDRADGSENTGSSVFTPDVARMYLSGNVGEAVIDAGLNLRAFTPVDPGATTATKAMTVDQFVDHLTISKPMGDWTFTAGKLWLNVGGFERHAFYDGDTYLTSLANGGFGAQSDPTDLVGVQGSIATPENSSGVAAAYKINDDHKVEVQVYNQTNRDSQLFASNNKRHSYGLAYWGSFADKMVMPYLSYTIGAADTATTNVEQTFMAAGFRLAPMENLSVDLEYLANASDNGTNKDETNSTIVEARYKMGMYVPVLKYEMSKDKAAGTDNFDRNAFAVALEIVPNTEDAFRYHVAYTSIKDDYKATGADDPTKNVITVGFKYSGDIAK